MLVVLNFIVFVLKQTHIVLYFATVLDVKILKTTKQRETLCMNPYNKKIET